MNAFQREKCIEYVKKLETWQVCLPFVNKVDPIKDNAPDYNIKVKEPMCYNEIKKKLETNKYKDIEELKYDIDLIWKNSETYNGAPAPYTLMALEGRNWLLKKIKNLPSTAEEFWFLKVNRLSRKINDALQHPPSELDPTGNLTKKEKEYSKPVRYRSKGLGKGKRCGKTISF